MTCDMTLYFMDLNNPISFLAIERDVSQVIISSAVRVRIVGNILSILSGLLCQRCLLLSTLK